MSDEYPPKKTTAIYEPGTLEQTRRNIGEINREEAQRMTKVLGGQIFTEKPAPVDYSSLPKQPVKYHSHAVRAGTRFAPVQQKGRQKTDSGQTGAS